MRQKRDRYIYMNITLQIYISLILIREKSLIYELF